MSYVFTSDEVKNQLKELNKSYDGRKTFGDLYAGVDLAAQRQLSDLSYDYGIAMNQAYTSSMQQKSAIAGSTLGAGSKQSLYEGLDDTLAQAFDTYRQNYLSGKQKIDTSVQESKDAIDKMLTEQSNNVIAYQQSIYGYLNDLYNKAYALDSYAKDGVEDETLKGLFENDNLWSRYVKTETQNGEEIKRLMTEEELMAQAYDVNRELTTFGVDYYDQMLNSFASQHGTNYSFNTYLKNVNPELYDWSVSQNPYDASVVSEYGINSNLASLRKYFGLDSTDAKYQFSERLGAIPKSEMDTSSSELNDKLNGLIAQREKVGDRGRRLKRVASQYSDLINDIETFVNDYHLSDYVTEKYGSWEELKTSLESVLEQDFQSNILGATGFENIAKAEKIESYYNNVIKELTTEANKRYSKK